MSYLLACDPDVSAPGLALFRMGITRWDLEHAGRCRTTSRGDARMSELGPAAATWVHDRVGTAFLETFAVEWPRVYPAGHGKAGADPNDLIELAGAAIAVFSGFPGAVLQRIAPRDWKGTLRKPERAADPYIVEERVIDRLNPLERAVWTRDAAGVAPTPRLEITDAIGIGLHAVGRGIVTTRHRVIAR